MILIYTQYGSALFSIIKKIVILLLDHIKLVHSMLYTSHKTTGRANQMRITQSTNIHA